MSDAQTHITMFGVALLMSTFIALAGARIYERCELARDLLKLGVDRDHVATWVCIAFHESRFDTAARNPHSGDHGLLQISELYWCGPGKACGAPCSAFRDDDISDDVQCALRIHEEHTRLQGNGFLAWVVYPHHCKHNAKKYLVDCDSSIKNSPSKFDDRARYLKSYERNVTTPQFVNYPDIDKLKPPYLAINELFKGSYANEFERTYYNNKRPYNWLNFKINNIDELKLPEINNNGNLVFTTPSTTTTTNDPALVGIKPPSPRKIESNQFRRRMMNLETISARSKDKSDDVPRKTLTETSPTNKIYGEIDLSENPFINLKTLAPINKTHGQIDLSENPFINLKKLPPTNKIYGEIDLSENPFINLKKLTTKSSTEIPYPTRELSSYSKNYISGFTLTTPRTLTTSTRSTSIKKLVSTQKHNSYTTPIAITSRRGKSRYVPDVNFSDYTRTQRPSTSSVDQSNRNETKINIGRQVSANNSKKDEQRRIETTTQTNTTTNNLSKKPVTGETSQAKTINNLSESSSDITQKYETTPKPLAAIRPSVTTQTSRFNWNRSRNSQTTTSKPFYTWTTRASLPTSPSPAPKKIGSAEATSIVTRKTTTTTESAPTVKTTQSIFDLYLNPTKATIKPFKFPSFENNPFKIRIFSGGTTTPPLSFLNSKNHKR